MHDYYGVRFIEPKTLANNGDGRIIDVYVGRHDVEMRNYKESIKWIAINATHCWFVFALICASEWRENVFNCNFLYSLNASC